jgi:hypothetical protein
MKKKITYMAFLLFTAMLFCTQAAETSNLEIVMTRAVLMGQKEVSAYVYKTKTYEPKISYEYTFYCLLKNISNAEITVATKSLSPAIMHAKEGDTPMATLSIDKTSYKGSQIVPSVTDLGLVALRPGESAAISWKKDSFTQLQSVKVQYNPQDIFDKRFGYWTGRVTGDSVEIMTPKK